MRHRQAPRSARMRPYTLIAGDFVATGGMDRANLALAHYLARQGGPVRLVAHRVADELLRFPNVRFVRVPKPAGAYMLGEPLLDAVGQALGAAHAGRGRAGAGQRRQLRGARGQLGPLRPRGVCLPGHRLAAAPTQGPGEPPAVPARRAPGPAARPRHHRELGAHQGGPRGGHGSGSRARSTSSITASTRSASVLARPRSRPRRARRWGGPRAGGWRCSWGRWETSARGSTRSSRRGCGCALAGTGTWI